MIQMKTIRDILTLSTQYLQQKQVANAKRQAEEILCDVLGLKRINLYTDIDRPLTDPELESCRHYLARRVAGEPLAYIHGSMEFADCRIAVNRDVLIPRQETEILTDMLAKELAQWERSGKVILDLCCGSGCIGIALKKKFPDLEVEAADISEKALTVAQQNAASNGVELHFHQGDLFEPLAKRKFHGIVCNPPYISEAEYAALEPEVRDYEPQLALLAQEEGLSYYKRLAKELPNHLNAGGKVWLEIGSQQGETVLSLFQDESWKTKKLEKDWAGHSRFIFLEIE